MMCDRLRGSDFSRRRAALKNLVLTKNASQRRTVPNVRFTQFWYFGSFIESLLPNICFFVAGVARVHRHRDGVLPAGSEMPVVPFLPFSILLGILGVLCVGLTGFWSQHWLGGVAWDGSFKMFNWHPVLMVTGMLVLYGSGVLVYRVPLSWEGPKLPWKLLHAALTLSAFILVVLGLVAVFEFHNCMKIPNMYSLHSWLGLTAVLLFSCQWLMGFASFLLPWAPVWLRVLYKPIHVFFGSAILSLTMAACISGINEKLFFRLTNSTTPYSKLPAEAWFANFLGMLILIYGLLVLWALAIPAWKRPDANSQDMQEPLLQHAK